MRIDPIEPPRKRRWRWWAVVLLNVAGLALIIPLLRITVPLVGVWWHTRSQEGLAAYQHRNTQATANKGSPSQAAPAANGDQADSLNSLTSKAGAVDSFSQKELQDLVSRQFGVANKASAGSKQFDLASAVFDSISRTTIVFNGRTYYGYKVNLVDPNGNHKTNIDCFTEPNLEYERSMATMELINSSAQLKRIYQAMAPSLAEKSASATNSADPKAADNPALRLDPSTGKPR